MQRFWKAKPSPEPIGFYPWDVIHYAMPYASKNNRVHVIFNIFYRMLTSTDISPFTIISAEGVIFKVFQLRIASFRLAGVALPDIPTCFMTCQKWFCVAGAISLHRFQKMRSISLGRRSTLDTSDVILRGRRSTLDLSCCVFSANRIVSAARSGDKVQIRWQGWHFVTCHENRRTPRTKRRFCSRSMRKLVGKRWFWTCKVWNVRTSRTKCSLWCSNMSRLESLASLVPSVSMGVAAKPILVEGFKTKCNVVLRGRRGTSWHSNMFHDLSKMVLCGRRNTFAPFSEDAFHFPWQAQHFGHLRCHFGWQAQHFRRVVLLALLQLAMSGLHDVVTLTTPHSTLCTPHFTLHTLHSTLYTLQPQFPSSHSTLYTLHSTLYTPHSTLYTPHFTLHTPHFTLCTPHFKLNTLHSTLYTLHCALRTLNVTLNTAHFPLYTLHLTLYTPHSTLYTPHLTLYTLHSTLYTPHFTLHTLHLKLHTPHSHTLHFALYTLHSTLFTAHSTLYILHFTLHTLHPTLYTPHFTLYTPHFTFFTPRSTLYTPQFALAFSSPTTMIPGVVILRVGIRVRGLHLVFFRMSLKKDNVFSPHCHVGFLFFLLHPASAASSSAAATSSTQHHQHIISTTPSTQHHQHNIIYTTPSTQHHRHNTINTTPSTQHHQHIIINTTSSRRHHLHNICNTTPSTLHHQKQHHQHNIINTPSKQHHQHYTTYTTSSKTPSSTQHHQHDTIKKTPSTQHHQHTIINNTINTTPSRKHHQHNTINTPSSAQHHQHNTINTTPSTQHHQHNISLILRGRCSIRCSAREVRGSPATIEYFGRRLLLRGRCSTWSTSVSFCVAGAAFGAPPERSAEVRRRLNTMAWTPAAFARKVQELEDLSLILSGRCSTRSTPVPFCVAGAALSASQSHFAWQVQHSE